MRQFSLGHPLVSAKNDHYINVEIPKKEIFVSFNNIEKVLLYNLSYYKKYYYIKSNYKKQNFNVNVWRGGGDHRRHVMHEIFKYSEKNMFLT